MALSAFELCEETFGMSRDDLESIIAFLRSAESRQMSHSDVEKLVRERSYELSRKLFQAHVDSRGPGEAAAPVRGADGVERDQERIHERGLTTIFGEIRVKRFGYGAEGADSLHPLDAELNLPRERYSFELRRTAAVEVSKGAFDEAVASLGRHTGAKVGKRQVEELAGRAAEDCQECGRRVRGQHPLLISKAFEVGTVHFGPRLLAFAAFQKMICGVSYDKIRLGFEQMLGFPVARSTLCRAMQRLARRAKPTRDALVEALRASPVVYADETGWKQGGRRVWLWVFTNLRETVYEILPGRGFEQAASVLGKNYAGTLG